MGGITTTLFQRPRDPQFNNTTLLLSGNFPTNGAQNNTFLDSSSNNFSITRNGNTTQGSFSPFSQAAGYWSNYFDGNGDNLSNNGASGQFAFGTGAFTIEFWMYAFSATNRQGLYSNNTSSMGSAFVFAIAGTNPGRLDLGNVGSSSVQTANDAFFANRWHHVALVREGTGANQTKIYVDGVEKASGTYSDNISVSREAQIGSTISFGEWFNGYLSNVRIVKGRAVYTSAFTPSTTPLSATTGGQNPPTGTQTSLLTAQSNRFVDNSGNDYAITRGGDTSVQAFSPFVPSGAYDTTAVGGSGYFDGSGDSLTRAFTSTTDGMYLQGSTYTIEAFVYPTALTGSRYIYICNAANVGAFGYNTLYLSGTTLAFAIRVANSGTEYTVSGGTLKINEWAHIAVTVSANSARLFLNGTQVGSTTTIAANTFTPTGAGIGQNQNGAAGGTDFVGYISGLRITQNQALATTTFTPPVTPVNVTQVGWNGDTSAVTGTVSLLLNFTNAGIVDSTAKNVLETVGNAQISTTQWRFGGSSIYLDGTGDWLFGRPNPLLDIGSGDFTFETWLYITSTIIDYRMIIAKASSTNDTYISLRGGGTGGRAEVVGSGTAVTISLNNTISQNTWTHFAVVRSGTTVTIYVNGTSIGTGTLSTNVNFSDGVGTYIGRWGGATTYEWPGYLDDLRITRFARYTANFNVPTIGFTDR